MEFLKTFLILFDEYLKYGVIISVIFTMSAILLYHILYDKSQINNTLKITAIVGVLLLLYK